MIYLGHLWSNVIFKELLCIQDKRGDPSEVSANNHSEMARVTFAPIHWDVPVFVTKSGLGFYLQKICETLFTCTSVE